MNSLFSPSKGCDLFDQSREPGEFYIARFVRSVVNFSTTSNFYYLYAGTGRETDHQVSRDEERRREDEITFNTRCSCAERVAFGG